MRSRRVSDKEVLKTLDKEVARWICGDRQLGVIYGGHAAADSAYMQRILA